MKENRTLITGATGLVGSALRNFYPNAICVSSKDADLTDWYETSNLIAHAKPNHVIHLAAEVGGLFKNMNDNTGMLLRNNIMTNNIIRSCVDNKIKKFTGCLSTCIFPAEVEYPIHENVLHDGEPHESNFGYAYAKRMMEVYCRAISEQYDYKYKCIIPTNIYGPHDNFSLKNGHVIPALIHKAYIAKRDNTDLTVAGSGFPVRQFIYSGDLAHLIFKLDNHKYDWVSPMTLADTREYSIFDVARIIAEYFGVFDRTGFNTNLPDGQHKKTADTERMNRYIEGFKFTPLEIGLRDTCDWFVRNYEKVRK